MKRFVRHMSRRARARRAALFRSVFTIDASTTILDAGSESGEAIHLVLAGTPAPPEKVYIADISEAAVAAGAATYGFQPVVLREGQPLPFQDGFFDIIYCSSVIEHVTVDKRRVWSITSGQEFRSAASAAQHRFAAEIRRVGRAYFVQTPSRSFPVESHTWLPIVGWLPRPLLLAVLRFSNRFWIKQTKPDFNLLDQRQLAALFPDAEIHAERFLGMTKSIIAVKRASSISG
jgi:SAM-dependent methyltransferase